MFKIEPLTVISNAIESAERAMADSVESIVVGAGEVMSSKDKVKHLLKSLNHKSQ